MADRTMTRGDTLQYLLQVNRNPVTGVITSGPQSDPIPPGSAPLDITGGKLWFTLKRTAVDPDNQAVALLSSPASGVAITIPTQGRATATVPPLATQNFPDGPVVLLYDVQFRDAAGVVTTTESGTYTVNPDVTRSVA